MLNTLPSLSLPPDETVIWRYVTWDKLLSLLSSKTLYLTRLDRLPDKWEGAWTAESLRAVADFYPPHKKLDWLFKSLASLRQAYFVNCWHMSPHESAALWGLYSGRAGMAIRSTIGRLKASIDDSRDFYLGPAVYVDHASAAGLPGGAFGPAFAKRRCFEHERELRLMHFHIPQVDGTADFSRSPVGISASVDPAALVDSILLSPDSEPWHVDLVVDLLTRYLAPLASRVCRSNLHEPFDFGRPS